MVVVMVVVRFFDNLDWFNSNPVLLLYLDNLDFLQVKQQFQVYTDKIHMVVVMVVLDWVVYCL